MTGHSHGYVDQLINLLGMGARDSTIDEHERVLSWPILQNRWSTAMVRGGGSSCQAPVVKLLENVCDWTSLFSEHLDSSLGRMGMSEASDQCVHLYRYVRSKGETRLFYKQENDQREPWRPMPNGVFVGKVMNVETGAVVTEIKSRGFRRWQVVTCVGMKPSVQEVEAEGIDIFAGKKVDMALLKEAPIQDRFFTSGGGWHRFSRGHQKAVEKGYYEREPAAKAWVDTFLSVWKPGAALASGGGHQVPPLPERLTGAELATQIRRLSHPIMSS